MHKGVSFQVFDDLVPFVKQQHIYDFCINSSYALKGWNDRLDLHITKHDLHSRWNLDDLIRSGLYEHVLQALDKANTGFTSEDFEHTTVNIVRKDDYYYSHTHGKDCLVVLYYANLEWHQEWAGETIFFDKQNKEAVAVNSFKPGRIIVFDGNAPHSIRPQSIVAPDYRFTIGTFFRKCTK